jgi:hypothetical protein
MCKTSLIGWFFRKGELKMSSGNPDQRPGRGSFGRFRKAALRVGLAGAGLLDLAASCGPVSVSKPETPVVKVCPTAQEVGAAAGSAVVDLGDEDTCMVMPGKAGTLGSPWPVQKVVRK